MLGGNWLQDSLTHGLLPALPLSRRQRSSRLPGYFARPGCSNLSMCHPVCANVVPPVTNPLTGQACFAYQTITRTLAYSVTLSNPGVDPLTITASHIHTGTIGLNGPMAFDLWNGSEVISTTHSLQFTGTLSLAYQQKTTLLDQGFYIDASFNRRSGRRSPLSGRCSHAWRCQPAIHR